MKQKLRQLRQSVESFTTEWIYLSIKMDLFFQVLTIKMIENWQFLDFSRYIYCEDKILLQQ